MSPPENTAQALRAEAGEPQRIDSLSANSGQMPRPVEPAGRKAS